MEGNVWKIFRFFRFFRIFRAKRTPPNCRSRRRLSNGAPIVSQFAQKPQFRPPQSFHKNAKNIVVFPIAVVGVDFPIFYFLGLFGLRDLSGRILRKISVSNAALSPRNSFSSLVFGRKRILNPIFGRFPTFVFSLVKYMFIYIYIYIL